MSNSFNQKNVEAFLVEEGCDIPKAKFISNFVFHALRNVSRNLAIAGQEVSDDFNHYKVSVAAHDGEGFSVDYTATKVGAGFYDHKAEVTTPETTYAVSRYVHTPLDETSVEATLVVSAPNITIEAPAFTVGTDGNVAVEVKEDEVKQDEVKQDEVKQDEVKQDEVKPFDVEKEIAAVLEAKIEVSEEGGEADTDETVTGTPDTAEATEEKPAKKARKSKK